MTGRNQPFENANGYKLKKPEKCYTIGKWEKSCFNSSQRKIEFLCPMVSLALKESMRLNSLDFEKKPPYFRPPKYTGITLSLLSIFVLVSMLAVWEKMANVPDLPEINLLAWEKSKQPIEKIRVAFQKEASCIINTTYLSLSELSLLPDLNSKADKPQLDILLLPKIDRLKSYFENKQYDNRGIVAYFKENIHESAQNLTMDRPSPLYSLINRSKQSHSKILSFLRFLKAPTQGQVEFAVNGWTGVDEDHWDIGPNLKSTQFNPANHG